MDITRSLRAAGSGVLAGTLLLGAASAASADQIRDDQWALEAFQAEKVWQESTGKGVTVAVIDDGVNGAHPDLVGNVLPGKNYLNGGRGDEETVADHGTSMASLIAGHGHGAGGADGVKGLAPDAQILPLKFQTGKEEGLLNKGTASWAEALKDAVDQGADIINMSFGGYGLQQEEKQAIAYAAKKDVPMIAGSGNNGSGGDYFPAAAPGVVAVGAMGRTGKVWEESNYGSHLLLSAPGEYIRSAAASKPYRLSNGTSDATAYVSAAAALLRAKFPDLTAGQIVNRLTKTALMPAAANSAKAPDPHYGYGVIRPYRALTEDIPAGPKNGPLKVPEAVGAEQTAQPDEAGGSSEDQAKDDEDGLGLVVFGIIGVGALAVLAVILVVVAKTRGRRNGPPPGSWGGPGVPGPPPHRPRGY